MKFFGEEIPGIFMLLLILNLFVIAIKTKAVISDVMLAIFDLPQPEALLSKIIIFQHFNLFIGFLIVI